MKKLGKNVNLDKETVEAYCNCFSTYDQCIAMCYGNSAAQSYAMQYYGRFPSMPSATGVNY